MVYNFVGMPYQQNNSDNLIYRDHSSIILQKSEGQPVYLLGEAFCEDQQGNPLATHFGIDSLCNPPLIPFQVPYYLTRDTRKTMEYKKEPVSGEYYLCEKEFANKYRPAFLYEFRENWIKNELVLFKYPE
jgi:hypothetical protein